jgi:hypothetical protein
MKVDAKLTKLVPLSHKFAKPSRVGIFRNERSRSTPLDPKLMFCVVSDHFVTARKSMQNWPNLGYYRTSSLTQSRVEFFATNAPDPLNLTQDLCFGAFRTVSLLHESRCKTGRTGAINAQVRKMKLLLNFSQRTHVIHSIGPKTHILERFGPFRYCTKVDAKLAELVPLTHKFAKQSRVRIFDTNAPHSLHWTQNWPNWCH